VTQSVVHYGPLTLNYHSICRKFVSGRGFDSIWCNATVIYELYCGEACKLCSYGLCLCRYVYLAPVTYVINLRDNWTVMRYFIRDGKTLCSVSLQVFCRLSKSERGRKLWYATQLIIATSVLPIAWSMTLTAATAHLIVSLTEQLDQRCRTFLFLHGIVSLSRPSILLTNDGYTRWSSNHWSLAPVHQWLIEQDSSMD
jgi:hypothetical protein